MTNIVTSNLALICPQCGGNQFIQPANPNLNSNVTCSGCKAVLAIADLADAASKKEAIRLASELARSTFGKMLK